MDYSNPEMNWYTWGFEGVKYFAHKLPEGFSGELNLMVRAQACDKYNQVCAGNLPIQITIPEHFISQKNNEARKIIEELIPTILD